MNAAFVADASVAVSWSIASQSSPLTDRLLDEVAAGAAITVPPLWPYEVANSLVSLLRRRRIQKDDYTSAHSLLSKLSVSIDDEGPRVTWLRVADLALEHRLTVYDASYLELAVRKQLPLASRDGDLNRAAVRCRVQTLL
ncbi:MAG TPA: type II toxin-antitoxin system VapC family toxin [Bryobacteraceae bacterium]|nr:type II toxin-antitoxin system VapC family toxin [Bryobacteraceae bacterium]